MLVATLMTSVQPSSETISKEDKERSTEIVKENEVEGDGLDQTLGTRKANASEPPMAL